MTFKILFRLPCTLLLITYILMASCSNVELSPYQSILKEELDRGVRYDTLFHGLHFNMTSTHFYEHCFEMNRQGLFFQNSGAEEIIIKYDKDFKHPVEFIFYPDFEREQIAELSGYFYYPQGNGFNKEFYASRLQLELVKKLEEWYGGRPFLKVPGPDQYTGDAYVKIDGNRQIMLWNHSGNHRVLILFADLTKKVK